MLIGRNLWFGAGRPKSARSLPAEGINGGIGVKFLSKYNAPK